MLSALKSKRAPPMSIKKIIRCCMVLLLCAEVLLSANILHASVDSARLETAITASRQALLEQRTAQGYWISSVETNTLYTSLQILLYFYLNRQDEAKENIAGLCRYLLHAQAQNGSWPFYDGGAPDLGLTVLNYFALKLSGYGLEEPALQRSCEYVRGQGGAEAANGMYKILLALFDQFSFPDIPAFPAQGLICIAPQLSWLRIMMIPLMVVAQEKAFYHPPEQASIAELFISGSGGAGIAPAPEIASLLQSAAAKAEHSAQADNRTASGWRPGYRIYAHWLLARQNETDGLFYDYMPNTFFALLSLKAIEDRIDGSPAIDKALQGLRAMQLHLPAGIYQPPADDAIPSTFSVVFALLHSGLSLEDEAVKNGVDFLWSKQQAKYGDWVFQTCFPVLPGGWGFTLHSETFPDTDDTASALVTLKTAYGGSWESRWGDFNRGLQWLLAMQNWDGGWGTWDRSSLLTQPMKEALPPVVLNESVVDHTTRVLNALSQFGYTEANSCRVARAVRWLESKQLDDGSWEGAWFVDYVYQTANVLGALALVQAEQTASSTEKSLGYILEKQNSDGGWGESPYSFSAKQYIALGHSSPAQTALVLFGLLNFLKGAGFHYSDMLRAPVNSAVNYLLATQTSGGLWNDPCYAGVVFPEIQYARYPVFQESIILLVLGMYNENRDFFVQNQVAH